MYKNSFMHVNLIVVHFFANFMLLLNRCFLFLWLALVFYFLFFLRPFNNQGLSGSIYLSVNEQNQHWDSDYLSMVSGKHVWRFQIWTTRLLKWSLFPLLHISPEFGGDERKVTWNAVVLSMYFCSSCSSIIDSKFRL